MRAERAWEALRRLAQASPGPRFAGRIVEEAAAAVGAREVALWLGSRDLWHCRARWISSNRARPAPRAAAPSCVLHGVGSPERLTGGTAPAGIPAGRGPGWLLVAPLPGERGCLAARLSGRRPPAEARQALEAMAAVATGGLRAQEEQGRLRRLAATDELTGAMNYRGLGRSLGAHVKRAAASKANFSILMADVDHLKEYNERHGHLGGSELLRRVGSILLNTIRPGDVVAKYGGDEFVLILPRTGAGLARAVGEQVRRAVSAGSFPGAARGTITLSVGVAQFPEDGRTVKALLRAADRALFAAKRLGRNRVQAAARAA